MIVDQRIKVIFYKVQSTKQKKDHSKRAHTSDEMEI